jgi:TonB family protein
MLMHEREHVRAGDVRLAALGQLLVLAQPWNLPLVWQWRRLREAVEVDCDCRVLRLDPDARAYGALLLEVGRRRALPQLALAFAEPRTFLERRIDLLTRARHGGRHAAGLAGLALLAAGVAVCTRDPLAVRPPLAIATVMTAQAPDRWQEQPVFTPFTTPPRLRNADEISRELERTYPRLLRDAGIGGQAMMWFFIDEMGRTRTTRLQESTGYPALDEAASRVAAAMQFTPALNRAKPVSVWVQIPIRFSTEQRDQTDGTRARSSTRVMTVSAPSLPDERSERAAIQTLEQEAARGADVQAERDGPAIEARLRELTARLQRTAPRISWGTVSDLTVDVEPLVRENATRMRVAAAQRNAELPRFTPFTEPPRLLNRPEIGRALEQNYPPLLRDAGIGGQVMLWFNIDERGRVARAVLQRSSNYPALDDAAIRVAESMRFTPAKNRQDPVSVWVQIPIRFATK